jgi:hypothetical protein
MRYGRGAGLLVICNQPGLQGCDGGGLRQPTARIVPKSHPKSEISRQVTRKSKYSPIQSETPRKYNVAQNVCDQ